MKHKQYNFAKNVIIKKIYIIILKDHTYVFKINKIFKILILSVIEFVIQKSKTHLNSWYVLQSK